MAWTFFSAMLRQDPRFGPPRPNAGEGLGVRGIPIEMISTRNAAPGSGLNPSRINQLCASPSPLTPLPRWGEGNRRRLSSSRSRSGRPNETADL